MRNMRFGLVSAAAFSLTIVASGWTQNTRPADNDAPRDNPPRDMRGDNDRPGDPWGGAGNGGGAANGGAQGGSYSDYPADEVRAVPPARANAVRARLEHERAQRDLYRWIDRSWDDFLNSRDYLDATGNERKAQDAYNKERDRVLRDLNNDSNYRALKELVADMDVKMQAQRPRSIAETKVDVMEDMLAMATVKLGYMSQLSAMEAAALSADRAVVDARNSLLDAGNRGRELRRNFDRSLRRNPDFLASRTRIDDLKINKIVASAFLESAINARAIALDYAYYVHRWDQYKYSQYGIYGDYYSPYYGGSYYRQY